MKRCPKCREEPYWHFAGNTSHARGQMHYIFCACAHFAEIDPKRVPVPNLAKGAIEERAEARALKLFDEYTAKWTEERRAAYRDQLYPPHTGEEYERHGWVKETRVRLANQKEFFPAIPAHYSEPKEPGDYPF